MVMISEGSRGSRPSPEALLKAAGNGCGRLKIFLGAAPGVGKTYEMLETAQERRRDGIDIVVGLVETHGRAETEALLGGFEIIPRKKIDYRGHVLEEMDLDAVLARRPQIVLVDELAHTNAPGSRHPKRYLDVEEILAAGIDVYTTLNIQHVDSLNDVVARITRIRVRETVPDSVLDRADDIEIVDLAPDDLIQRLNEGKVYVPKQAARALSHYFAPGNLTALRELALRRTAQRVDEQLLTHMQAHAIEGPWPAGERVLVCISESPHIGELIRHAKRVADQLHASWIGLYVETQRTSHLTEAERDRIADAMRLAERLGGEAVTVPGRSVVGEVLAYARANNVTQIIIGKSHRSRWFEILHGSVVHDLVRQTGGISVHVIAPDATPDTGRAPPKQAKIERQAKPVELYPYLIAFVTAVAALLIGKLLEPFLGIETIDLVFLIGVIAVAVRYGLWPSLAVSVFSMLAYNFFFIPPIYTLTIADPKNVAALFFFLLVALVTSNLAARVRTQAITAQNHAGTTEALYAFSRKIAAIGTQDDLLWATAYQIASMLKLNVVLLLPDGGSLAIRAGYPPEDRLDEADMAAASWAWENDRAAGRGADTLPGAKRLFLPLRAGQNAVGVLGIGSEEAGALLTPDKRRLLDALMDQAAVAVERVRLSHDIADARLVAETERLRAALLTSLSHDLKTPLASIIGAVTSLQQYDKLYDEASKQSLVSTIHDEAERLNRFIANLLDMTRLESGSLKPSQEPVDLSELVGTALQQSTRLLRHYRIEVRLDSELPMLKLDPVLFEQAFLKLLDNVAKYAPEGSKLTLAGYRKQGSVLLEVMDEGPGIPAEDLERVFEKFYRVRKQDQQRAGTGLGLPICRGFIEALGGTIRADNRSDRSGAIFTIVFPQSLIVLETSMPRVVS